MNISEYITPVSGLQVQSTAEQASSGLRSTLIPLRAGEKIFRFDDGEETVVVLVTLQPNGEYTAIDDGTYDCDCDQDGFFSKSPVGYGVSIIGAIADLFERLPRSRSDREERDEQAARFDRARDLRKHSEAV